MKVQDGDELVAVRPASADAAIIMVTEQGQALLCSVSSIPERNRNASGVIGMKFKDEFRGKDRVVAVDVVNNPQDEYLLVASEKGYGKATPLQNSRGEAVYREKGRGGMGVKTFAVDESDKPTGPVVDAKIVTAAEMNGEEGHEVFIISARGQVVRINLAEVKVVNTRQTKGVIIWRERGGDDSVVSISCFRATDYSQSDPTRANGADGAGGGLGSVLEQAEAVAAQADSRYDADIAAWSGGGGGGNGNAPAMSDDDEDDEDDYAVGDGVGPDDGSDGGGPDAPRTNGQGSLL